jgi:hypothetical protein
VPLEPLPETLAVLRAIGEWSQEDFVAELTHSGRLVHAVVPECVGMSLSLLEEGLTFTLVASSDQIAALDAVQYTVGGPCIDAVLGDRTIDTGGNDGLFDEERWARFARAGAAAGVLSTLSMPLGTSSAVTGGVNFYASTTDAFAGRHEALAAIVGAWAPAAVINTELTFATRLAARKAPRHLGEQAVIDQATGFVAAARGLEVAEARRALADAAGRAGIPDLDLARALLKQPE